MIVGYVTFYGDADYEAYEISSCEFGQQIDSACIKYDPQGPMLFWRRTTFICPWYLSGWLG